MAWQNIPSSQKSLAPSQIPLPKVVLLLFFSTLIQSCGSLIFSDTPKSAPASSGDETQVLTTKLITKTQNSTNTNKPIEPTAVLKDQSVVQSTEQSTETTEQKLSSNLALSENTPETVTTDLWDVIRDGFTFDESIPANELGLKRIENHRQRIIRSPTMVSRITKNASPYLHFIVNELQKNNIPLEIALLPIVESHYDPFAYSPGRASGLWQFIPSTGKRFGLTQDWWQDERRDTIAATGSAIQYLLYLHNRFDQDWLLALAAYNAGQGNVAKAIRKNKQKGKPTDYWSLSLPKETQYYVPKLLAWKSIIQDPKKFNIQLDSIDNKPHFEIVNVGSQIDLAQAAELSEVTIDEIYQLNPAYNRWATDPSPPHDLLVPVGKGETLRKNLENIPSDKRITWRRYIIKKHDTLSGIAQKFHTSINLISKINGISGSRIREGKALLIPSASKASDYYTKSVEQRLVKQQSNAPRKNRSRVVHKVKSGENLWDIARKYGVGVKSLARWNNMAPRDTLSINKKLIIWQKETTDIQNNNQAQSQTHFQAHSSTRNETRKLFYKVRPGDSLHYIASKFKVKVGDIKNWNQLEQQKYIQPGQLLTLYVDLTDRQLMVN
jgi:membrane-bound lytic murein transglycosylase D